MAAEVTAQGRCSVKLERLRTSAPAMMDTTFQRAIEAASIAFASGKSMVYFPFAALTVVWAPVLSVVICVP